MISKAKMKWLLLSLVVATIFILSVAALKVRSMAERFYESDDMWATFYSLTSAVENVGFPANDTDVAAVVLKARQLSGRSAMDRWNRPYEITASRREHQWIIHVRGDGPDRVRNTEDDTRASWLLDESPLRATPFDESVHGTMDRRPTEALQPR